eukprot:g338.t1
MSPRLEVKKTRDRLKKSSLYSMVAQPHVLDEKAKFDGLKMVVVVHRHGARFPSKLEMPGDVAWPRCEHFYGNYAAHLTPEGAFQAYALGGVFNKFYVEEKQLMRGVDPWKIGDTVRVHTSNRHRTLFTSWSLLRGMFPETPLFLSYVSDQLVQDRALVEERLRRSKMTLGIPIHVEDQDENDELLHQIKTASARAKHFKKDNVKSCRFFQDNLSSPKWKELADKLFKMSASEDFNPNKKTVDRMSRFKCVRNRIKIAEAHRNMVSFPNVQNLYLSQEEQKMIQAASDCFWKYMFRPALSNRTRDGIGRDAAGHLAGEISRLLHERMVRKSDLRFVEYSGHDTTLLALASYLGIDVPRPEFCSYWAFELYETSSEMQRNSSWSVRVRFEPDPSKNRDTPPRCLRLPLNGVYVGMEDVPEGPLQAERLIRYMADVGQIYASDQLRNIARICHLRRLRPRAWSKLLEKKETIPSPVRAKKFEAVFDYFDGDHDREIGAEELLAAFSKVGVADVTKEEAEGIIEFVTRARSGSDGGSKTRKMRYSDFLSFMHVRARLDSETISRDVADM